jgi:hypothetical protein
MGSQEVTVAQKTEPKIRIANVGGMFTNEAKRIEFNFIKIKEKNCERLMMTVTSVLDLHQ